MATTTARRVLMAVIESSYGVPKTTPVLGTDKWYQRLDQADGFECEAFRNQIPIAHGGGLAVQSETAPGEVIVKGRFATRLYPGIWSASLLGWAMTPINSGRSAPWTTTAGSPVLLPVGDMASLSFYEGFLTEDGTTYNRARYAGCKCDDIEVTAQDTGEGRVWIARGSFTGIRVLGNPWDSSSDPDATEFPLPDDANLPTGPYTFADLGSGTGTVTLGTAGGTNRASTCTALSIRHRNIYSPFYGASNFLTTYRRTGYETEVNASLRLKMSPTDRTTFRSQLPVTLDVKLDNGTNSLRWNMAANAILRDYKRRLPNEGEYMTDLVVRSQFSQSAGTALTFTAA